MSPMSNQHTQFCYAAAGLCMGEARRVYSSPNLFDFGRVRFPYGVGDVTMDLNRYGYLEQFNHGPNAPANENRRRGE
jgi:hypothetical protein